MTTTPPRRPSRSPGAAAPAEGQRIIRPAAARARVIETAKATITTSRPDGEETVREEFFPVDEFPAGVEPAHLKMGNGKTISLGPGTYEFIRLDVSLTMPTRIADLDATKEFISGFISQTLIDEENAWMGEPIPAPQAKRRG